MDHLPTGTSYGDSVQSQKSRTVQRAPAQTQYVASYQPTLPVGSEMPDEWGYPPSSAPQPSNAPMQVYGAPQTTGTAPRAASQSHPMAAPTAPTCRYPNCHRTVTRDERTQEVTEYCGLEHMRDAVRLGFALCPACKKCPRRTNSEFCGSLCQAWAIHQGQQLQLQKTQPHQQQDHHQRHPQRHNWQSPTVGSPSTVSNTGAVTWSNAARGSTSSNNASRSSLQGRYQQ